MLEYFNLLNPSFSAINSSKHSYLSYFIFIPAGGVIIYSASSTSSPFIIYVSLRIISFDNIYLSWISDTSVSYVYSLLKSKFEDIFIGVFANVDQFLSPSSSQKLTVVFLVLLIS